LTHRRKEEIIIKPNTQEISVADYLALKQEEKQHKYHAEKATIDGFTFDSLAEGTRYSELLILKNQGVISDLKIHPRYELLPKFKYKGKTVRGITYEADFEYCEAGQVIVEDVKGVATEAFKIKEKLFKNKYPQYLFQRILR